MTLGQKQNLLFFFYAILTSLAIIVIYHYGNPQWIYYRQAEGAYHQKDYAEAIEFYRKSLAKGKTNMNTILHLADSLGATKNFSEAAVYYRAYLEIYPEEKKVRHQLAKTLFWNGNLEEAQVEYQKIIEEK